MGNKRKGQLTTDSEWHKHLRKISKRFFWKGERIAEKKMISQKISENNTTLLTFEELSNSIEINQLQNIIDNNIAKKIIEAERDWRTSLESLNDFIIILEKEVGGIVTKKSLNKLMIKYNRNILQYAWEAESICYLLEIFEMTKESNLRNIFNKLIERVKDI